MLDKHAEKSIELIAVFANQIWGCNCEVGQVKVLNSPYAQFECPMQLYHKVNVILTYDRSILGIAIKTQKGNIWVDDLAKQKVYDGFESSKPDNIHHNFQVLDDVACEMIRKGQV